eukprot:TRINITY_DN15397_c0_g1_i1.p1 TRINITY_DN15397_c0_g1~~TRINITY_DN15397_c0_g1_i1.p1  ORF type:complete len:1280 (+),score=168.27 TRINITY_DN15397_c0_g1_i1:145-3984(+)
MEGVRSGNTPCAWFNRVYTTDHVRDSYTHRVCSCKHLNTEYNMYINPCFVIGRTSKLRVSLIKIVDDPRFDKAVLLVILLNVAVEIMEIPSLQEYDWTHDVTSNGNHVFLALFSLEAALKIGAMGFVMHRRAYLRDAWNVGDFLIVLLGIISEVFSGNKFNFIRLVRLVRPLRAVRRVRGMRVLVNTLFAAIPMMRDVLGLLLLVMYVFAILGIQMWKGILHKRCYKVDPINSSYSIIYNDTSVCGSRSCSLVPTMNITCDIKTSIHTEETFNFDYLWSALLLVFKVVTLDDWPENMVMVQEASSPYSWIYFVLLTLMGGYFCLNLVLAILAVVYTESQRKKMTAAIKQITPNDSIPFEMSGNERDVIKQKLQQHRREVIIQLRREGKLMAAKAAGRKTQAKLLLAMFQGGRNEPSETLKQIEWQETKEEQLSKEDHYIYIPEKLTVANYCGVYFMQTVGVLALGETMLPIGINEDDDIPSFATESDFSSSSVSSFGDEQPPWWRAPFITLVSSKYFKNALITITIINVFMMATDHQNASSELLSAIDHTNIFASWCFLFEMIFKLVGLGVTSYFKDNYNILDFTLVLLSIPEIFQLADNLSSFSAFRAFRGFRLMVRIKALRMTIDRIARSFSAVVWLLLLMLLLIFIFAILGLNIFGDSVPPENRENFRSLWEAGLTVFIVITGDTWATIMQRTMKHSGGVSVLYFIPLFVIGNLMLINLFIAIMIDHFKGSEHDAEQAFFTKGAETKKHQSMRKVKRSNPADLERHVKFNNGEVPDVVSTQNDSLSDGSNAKGVDNVREEEAAKEQAQNNLLTFERFWSRGWRVSISRNHGRPFWWRGSKKLWVLPLNLHDDDDLTTAEYAQLKEYQSMHDTGPTPFNDSTEPSSPKKDVTYKMACFSQYKPSPWEIRKLMGTSDFLSVLELPEAGNLRLFYYCSTRKTRDYVISLWQRTNATKRDFLQKLAEAGVLCPSSIPPTYKDFLQNDAKAVLRTESGEVNACERKESSMHRRFSVATTMSMESSSVLERIHLKANPYSLELFGRKSLGVFSRDNSVRIFLSKIILHPYFDDGMLAVILVNAIFLGLDDYYVDERPGGKLLIEVANAIFVLVFLLEMVSKVIVLGFKRYWKSVWNRVDAIIAIALLADVIGIPYANKLRCVRTLRLLVRLEALSVVVKALLRAVPQIAYICVVCLFVWVVFGILGVQLFKGKYSACNDSSVDHITNCSGVYSIADPTATDPNNTKLAWREWSNYRVHFDHIGMASVALFELSVTENWAPLM